jgi:putative salt-induced outer membrane protein YdiY
MRSLLCSVTLLVLLCVNASAAEAPQDVVVLTSGNRITGEVRGLSRGELAFRIAGIGTVDINWSAVESLETAQILDIDLSSGQRLAGSITTSPDGKLTVMTESGPRTIEKADAIRFTRIGATLRARTSGEVDFGLNFYTAGGHELDWVINGEVQNRTQNYLTEASLAANIRQTSGDTARDRARLTFDSRRYFAERWFAIGLGEAENDMALNLDSRFLFGLAGGRTLIQSNRNFFSLYGGFAYTSENYRYVPQTDSRAEALGTLEWDVFEIGGDTELKTKLTTYVGLNNSARTRVQFTTSLRRELKGHFFYSFNLFEEYDSAPPNGYPRSDFGASITVGYQLPRL